MAHFLIESIEELPDALARNEAIIRRGLVDVGEAFKEIVKGKMYRVKGYKTFADYCKGEWNLTDRYVRYTMNAAEALAGIGTIVPIDHLSEGVVREVAALPTTESRVEVVKKVLEKNPNPTAAEMRQEVEKKLLEMPTASTDKKTQKRVQTIRKKNAKTLAVFRKRFTQLWKKYMEEFSDLPLHELEAVVKEVISNH
jgi:hypothetical protein